MALGIKYQKTRIRAKKSLMRTWLVINIFLYVIVETAIGDSIAHHSSPMLASEKLFSQYIDRSQGSHKSKQLHQNNQL